MPMLDVGSMDSIKTGAEPIVVQKKVRAIVVAPDSVEDKAGEVFTHKDGSFSMVKFTLKLTEGPDAGRFTKYSCFTRVDRAKYVSWGLWKGGKPATEQEKEAMWTEREYLKDLKRFGDAIVVDFSTQSTEEAYGKELIIDIKHKDNDGTPYAEAKNPAKIK